MKLFANGWRNVTLAALDSTGVRVADKDAMGQSVEGDKFALHCRGDVRLYFGKSDCTPKAKKGRALLAVLGAEQRALTRTRIIDLLWSDRQEEQARASLRTLLADLKGQFNSRFDELLLVDRERIALAPGVRTDLAEPVLTRPTGELFEGLDHIDPELDGWLRVERQKWAKFKASDGTGATQSGPARKRSTVPLRPIAILLTLLATVLIGVHAWNIWGPKPGPMLAVLKIRDLTGSQALLASGVAERLRVELAQYPRISVIAGQSSEADILEGKTMAAAASALGATHLLEGRILKHDAETQFSFRLFEAGKQRPVWSTVVRASPTAISSGSPSVTDHVAELVGEVAGRGAARRGLHADAKAWSDYFRAFDLVTQGELPKTEQARTILFEVLARYPDFAPALSILASSTMYVSDLPLCGYGTLPQREARREARRYAARAIAAAPDYGPSYTALGDANYGLPESLPAYRKAVALSPGSAKSQGDLAYALELNGRWEETLVHRRKAAALNPLSVNAHYNLARALAATDRFDAARSALKAYLVRDVPEGARQWLIAITESEVFGDWSNSYVAGLQELKARREGGSGSQPVMWSALLLYGPRAALPYARPGSMTAHILAGDVPGTLRMIERIDSDFWTLGYETSAALHFLLARGQGPVLLKAYDRARRAGVAQDALNHAEIALLLRQAGRSAEASQMRQQLGKTVREMQGLGPKRHAFYWAVQRALEGRTDEAIAHLQQAHVGAWWAVSVLLDHPYNLAAFKPLHGDRRFRALVADYDRWVTRERRQAALHAREKRLPDPPKSPPPAPRLA